MTEARVRGRCASCGGEVRPGDLIERAPLRRGWSHAACASAATDAAVDGWGVDVESCPECGIRHEPCNPCYGGYDPDVDYGGYDPDVDELRWDE